jgi:(R,R)-butanediol dehydrogenase/meso-butanediol dehydrogenase/diacetyl reductase
VRAGKVEIGDSDARPGARERDCHRGAESACSAGHDGNLATEIGRQFYQALGRLSEMRALRFHAAMDIRHEELQAPGRPTGGQVLIAPVFAGICGTDVHEYAAGPLRTTVEPHPLTGGHVPQILGHELSAEVVEVGPDVDSLARGDRVSVMPRRSCGECALCRRGQEQMCELRAAVGLRHPWGGMADLALVDADQLFRMPDALTWEQGAMIEPTAVSWSAVKTGGVGDGDSVLVTGAGPIGALAALAAAAAGARVLVSEPNPSRGARAEELGFEVIDPREVEVAGACREWSPGGVDVAIECSGQESAIHASLAALRPGGRVVQAGVPVRPTPLDLASLMLRGLTIVGSVGFPVRCWPELMDEVAAGALPIDRVLTGRVTMENAVADGFERLLDPGGDAIKILIEVGSADGGR